MARNVTCASISGNPLPTSCTPLKQKSCALLIGILRRGCTPPLRIRRRRHNMLFSPALTTTTGISSHLRAKLSDWADRLAEAGCYSWAALSSNDSKTLYLLQHTVPRGTAIIGY